MSVHLEQGNEHLANYEPAQAVSCFEEHLKLFANSASGYLGLARAYLLLGQVMPAQDYIDKAESLARDQEKPEVWSTKGSLFIAKNNPDVAIATLKRANQWYKDHPAVTANLGKALSMKGDFEEAKHFSLKAIELASGNKEDIYFDLGMSSIGLEQYEEAMDYFVASIEENHTYLPSYEKLSSMARLLGMIKEAAELYEAAVDALPDNMFLRSELADLYLTWGKPEKAFDHALQLIGRRGKAQDFIRAGNLALLLEDMEASKEFYQYAIEADPNEPASYVNLGHLARLEEKRDLAVEHYTKAAELNQYSETPLLGMGLVYEELDGELEKAKICYLKAVELSPSSFDTLIHLASACNRLGELEEAEKYAEVAGSISDSYRDGERAYEILMEVKQKRESNIV